MRCPFKSPGCCKDVLCHWCLCMKEQLEEMAFHLREADADAAALIKLSHELSERFPGGKRPEWAVPSNCETAILYIDRLRAKVESLYATLEWLIPPAGCRNYDCEQAQIKVRAELANREKV